VTEITGLEGSDSVNLMPVCWGCIYEECEVL